MGTGENQKKPFKVVASYDTETTNLGTGKDARAFAVLYICSEFDGWFIKSYKPGREKIIFYRTELDFIGWVEKIISKANNYVPIIAAYNLMFDLQTVLYELNTRYVMAVCAQSSTSVYTLDLIDDEGNTVLRFWDTFYLEMGGLDAMGQTCGLAKAKGKWDYSKIRHRGTLLTEDEKFYAARDVQVIPAYLKYLIEAHDWMRPSDLGDAILTKTSIVRQMAARTIGRERVRTRHGSRTLLNMFMITCKQEQAPNYARYALRKACFRGGWTFTAANHASKILYNVGSLDVTSMHHLFITGRYVPEKFRVERPNIIQAALEAVINTPREVVLSNYAKPFLTAFHAKIRFTNLRLKSGTVFERDGIALIPSAKFQKRDKGTLGQNQGSVEADNEIRKQGWYDRAYNPCFAFGKLMSADFCELHLTELELYAMSIVYEWDTMTALGGEVTCKFSKPPDYVNLQSHILYERKNAMKKIANTYHEGMPYTEDIPDCIPEGISKALQAGTATLAFVKNYYNSTVKGQFNGIYGTMAQDILKPDYCVENGELSIDEATKVNPENYGDILPSKIKVLYTYGMRIVGGSRLHLALAMEMLYSAFGDKIMIGGGDTDSLKIAFDKSISDDDILMTLKPLHDASDRAINNASSRVRKLFPQYASDLKGIGHFDVESCGNSNRYEKHMEAWNKARVSLDSDGMPHVTCAGLSRPPEQYHIETFIFDLLKEGNTFEEIAPQILGYNTEISNEICHALQKKKPIAWERIEEKITDYQGNIEYVSAYKAVALYDVSRIVGDTLKISNLENVAFLTKQNRIIDTEQKRLCLIDGKPIIERSYDEPL